jgi:hypothetical protein
VLVRLVDTPETIAAKLAPHLKTAGATLVAIAEAGGWKVVIPTSQHGTIIPFSDFPKAEAAKEGGAVDSDTPEPAASVTEPATTTPAPRRNAFEVVRVDESTVEVVLSYGFSDTTEAKELARIIGDEAATITEARGKAVRVRFAQPGVTLFGFERREIERGFGKAGATSVDGLLPPAPIPADPQQRETPLFEKDEDEL